MTLGALSAAAAACSLAADFDGYEGGGAGAEAGAEGDGGAGGELDAQPDDGGSEADADAGAKGASCPDAAIVLCDDFSRVTPAVSPWEGLTNVGGTIAIGELGGRDQVLVTSVPGTTADAGPAQVAFLTRAFSPNARDFRFEGDIYYDQRPALAGEFHNFVKLRIVRPGGGYELVYLSVSATGNTVGVQDFPPSAPTRIETTPFAFPPGQWHHVELRIAVEGETSVVVDGVPAVAVPAPSWFTSGSVQLEVGMTTSTLPTTAITVGTDNVIFSAF